jgi:signal transduction histidine kinase
MAGRIFDDSPVLECRFGELYTHNSEIENQQQFITKHWEKRMTNERGKPAVITAQLRPSMEYVERELVIMLYQQPWLMSLMVGLVASCSTAYLFSESVPWTFLAPWLLLLNGVIFGRAILVLSVRKYLLSSEEFIRRRRQYTTLVWINGLAWGLPALALNGSDLTLLYFYSVVLAGFTAGAIPMLSFHPLAFNGFAGLSVTPLVLRMFTLDYLSLHILGVLAVGFVLINMLNVQIIHRRTRQQIEMEYENRQLVQQLTEEKERAESATAAKSRFLAAASHDLRQPSHALGLFLDALGAQQLTGRSRDLLANARDSAQSMNNLLEAHLDLSRLNAGVLTPARSAVSLKAVFDTLLLEFGREASAKEIELRVRGSNVWVDSDPTMLARILRNVLSNAIKHTAKGGVLLGSRRRGEQIRIEIYDTGIGMSSEELERVFEEFYQVDNPQRDSQGGLGLGLSIVRQLCLLLGHEMQLESKPGRGTVFRLLLQAAEPKVSEDIVNTPFIGDLAGARILIIDDEISVREAMSAMLESWSCEVLLAESRQDALRQLRGGEQRVDLVVADYRLREKETGPQAVEAVRSLLEKKVPAIIVTGDTAPDRLREAKESGHYLLHKPVAAVKLRSLASYLICG